MNRREFILLGLATLGARLFGKLPKDESSESEFPDCGLELKVNYGQCDNGEWVDDCTIEDKGPYVEINNYGPRKEYGKGGTFKCEGEFNPYPCGIETVWTPYASEDGIVTEWQIVSLTELSRAGELLDIPFKEAVEGKECDHNCIECNGRYDCDEVVGGPYKVFPDWWDMGVNGESIPINLMDVIECSLASPDYSIHHSDHEKREKVLEDWRKPTEMDDKFQVISLSVVGSNKLRIVNPDDCIPCMLGDKVYNELVIGDTRKPSAEIAKQIEDAIKEYPCLKNYHLMGAEYLVHPTVAKRVYNSILRNIQDDKKTV